MSDKSLYEILCVEPNATMAEIRAAYLKQAKRWHPDRNAGNKEEAERRFKDIAHAYEVLSNPEKRAAYDAAGAANQKSAASDGTMDEGDAFDLFISVLLDLAFELAESGADQIAIYQALVDMGCPIGAAKTLAQRAYKHGGNGKAGASPEEPSKAQKAATQHSNQDLNNPSDNQEAIQSNDTEDHQWQGWLFAIIISAVIIIITINSIDYSNSPSIEATEASVEVTEVAAEVYEDRENAAPPIEPMKSEEVDIYPNYSGQSEIEKELSQLAKSINIGLPINHGAVTQFNTHNERNIFVYSYYVNEGENLEFFSDENYEFLLYKNSVAKKLCSEPAMNSLMYKNVILRFDFYNGNNFVTSFIIDKC